MSLPNNIIMAIEEWPTYDSSHTFKYCNFPITEKEKLFKICSKYFIYCNQKDTEVIPQFVGINKDVLKSIIKYLFFLCSNKEWQKKVDNRLDYALFLKEYFIYIESVTNPGDDSYNVNKIFQDNKSKSIKSLSRLQLNELFSKILSEYDSKNTINYDLQDIKNIIYSILDKIKMNKHILVRCMDF
jgi:hypothetical protein